jgi:hypothetical protein
MFVEHFIIGLMLVAAGVFTLKFNYQLVGYTGSIGFVERYLGGGSTYIFLKLLSVLVCIGGFMYAFGLWDPVARWLLSPLATFFPHSSGL